MKINFDVPKTWQVKKLEELSHAQKGSIKIGPFGSLLKKAEYSDSGIRVLGIDHVLPNQLTWEKPKYIPEKKYKELAQYSVYPGDILVTNMGTVGRVCVVPDDFPVAIISSHLIKVTPDIKQIDPSYFSWVLNFCPLVVAQIRAKCHGAIMAGFNTTLLKSLEIPLPPIAEQKRIAAILDKADAVRRKRREAIRLTEELLRSTFLEMFGDPITNPKGWDMKPIGNLCTVVRGGSPRPIESFLGGTVPWIKIGDATKGDDLYIEKTEEFIREEGVKNSRYLEPGSLIFANCGVSLGFARVLKIGGCIHDGWLALSDIDPSLNKFFLLRLINSITNHFRAIAPDGTQPNLNTSIIKNFKIPVPPLKLQEEFCAILFRQVNFNSKNLESLDSLEHLFNSLLQRAFTGNL